jgi:hypothetical protein
MFAVPGNFAHPTSLDFITGHASLFQPASGKKRSP